MDPVVDDVVDEESPRVGGDGRGRDVAVATGHGKSRLSRGGAVANRVTMAAVEAKMDASAVADDGVEWAAGGGGGRRVTVNDRFAAVGRSSSSDASLRLSEDLREAQVVSSNAERHANAMLVSQLASHDGYGGHVAAPSHVDTASVFSSNSPNKLTAGKAKTHAVVGSGAGGGVRTQQRMIVESLDGPDQPGTVAVDHTAVWVSQQQQYSARHQHTQQQSQQQQEVLHSRFRVEEETRQHSLQQRVASSSSDRSRGSGHRFMFQAGGGDEFADADGVGTVDLLSDINEGEHTAVEAIHHASMSLGDGSGGRGGPSESAHRPALPVRHAVTTAAATFAKESGHRVATTTVTTATSEVTSESATRGRAVVTQQGGSPGSVADRAKVALVGHDVDSEDPVATVFT